MDFARNLQLLPPINAQTVETVSASGIAPSAEGAIGVERFLGGLRLSAAIAYHYARISNPRGTDVVDGKVQSTSDLPFDLNPSGVTVRFGIERSL